MGENINKEELVQYNDRRIYPEVAEYFRGETARTRAYEDAERTARRYWEDAELAMYRAAEDAGRSFDRYHSDADRQAYTTARNRYREMQEEARALRDNGGRDLLLNSPHREVKWIAEHCLFAGEGSEVEGHAKAILKMLPATTEEIWAEAKDNRGMCEVFDRFYEQAEADGIFSEGEIPAWHRQMAAFRNYIRRNYGSSYVRDFQPHVDRMLKAVEEDYQRKLAEAKAEWQHQDEAYRSEGARKAAETRRRNREALEGAYLGDVPEPVSLVHPARKPVTVV